MKFFIFLLIFSYNLVSGETISDSLREKTSALSNNPSRELVMSLAKEIQGNNKYSIHLKNDELNLTKKATEKLLAVPGHAQYFAEALEDERLAFSSDPSSSRTTYDRNRFLYLHDILMNLPSPETVQVLGHYLGDDRDTPPPPRPGQDWLATPANSFIATRALMDIGINHSPVPIHVKPWEQRALDLQRAWWEEVKSGKRSFSFHGQNVEYRFSPEGEVLTTPRDGSKDPEPLDRDNSRRSQQKKPVYTSPAFWGIAAGGIFVCLAVGWWLRVRYQRLQTRSVCL